MNNRSNRTDALRRLACFTLLTAAAFGYLTLYLAQDSLLALQDEAGQPHNRLIDLLVTPGLLSTMWGDGQRPLGIVDRLPLILGAGAWIVCAWYLGSCFAAWLWTTEFVDRNDRPLAASVVVNGVAIFCGLAVLSTLVLLIGLAGGLSTRWPLLLAVLAALAGAHWFRRRLLPGDIRSRLWVRSTPSAATGNQPPRSPVSQSAEHCEGVIYEDQFAVWMRRLLPIVVAALGAVYLFGAMLPPWEFDVLEYHLQAPKEFAAQGCIGFVPHNVYSNMPLGAEMHALAMMVLVGGEHGWWIGGLIGKTIIGCISLILAAMAGAWVTWHLGRMAGWISAGLTLASVGHAHEATSGLVDMVMAGYMVATLMCLHLLHMARPDRRLSWQAFLSIGVLSGAAAACKYPGIVLVMVPAAWSAMVSMYRRRLLRTHFVGLLAGFGVGWGVTIGPWLAKNALFTGNPFYPLLGRFLGAPGMEVGAIARWDRAHSPWATSDTPFSAEAAVDSTWQLLVASPFLNPTLMVLALTGCAVGAWQLLRPGAQRVRHPLPEGLWWWLWVLIVWWSATHRIDRFWLPALPLIAIHAAWTAHWVANRISASLALFIALVGLGVALLQISAGAGPVQNQFFVSLSALERETVEPTADGIINPVIPWINSTLNRHDRLLCIGEVKAYLFRIPVVYATCFNPPPGRAWLEGRNPRQQWEALREHDITHVLVDWAEIDRYRSPGNYGFSDWPTRSDIERLVQHGVLTRMITPFESSDVDVLMVALQPPGEKEE